MARVMLRGFTMFKFERQPYGLSGDPVPSFATDAEIALAERLRSQLEERYFGPSAKNVPMKAPSGGAR